MSETVSASKHFAPRREDLRLTTGKGNYIADKVVDGMLHAAFVRSPHANANIRSINVTPAMSIRGVVAVLTGADIAADGVKDMLPPASMLRRDGTRVESSPRQLLVRDRIRHLAEPVAMVLAITPDLARDGAEAVSVDYEVLPAIVTLDDAEAAQSTPVWEDFRDNQAFYWSKGDEADITAALDASHHVARVRSHSTRVSANPMEPRCALGMIGKDGRPALYLSHQMPHIYHDNLAAMFGMDKTRFRVVIGDIGGSFGMKAGILREETLVFWAAMHLKKPVKWVADRSESFLTDDHGRDIEFEGELGLDRRGHFTALRVRYRINVGAYLSGFSASAVNNFGGIVGVYRTPKVLGEITGYYTNTQVTAPYRGAGRPDATLVIERLIDIAAREMKIDPFALRMRNLIPSSAMPYQTPFTFRYDCGEFDRTMRRAAELIDYDGFKARRKESKKRGRLRGLGIANPIEVAGGPFNREGTEHAWVEVRDDGSVILRTGSVSTGQSVETSMSDLVAQRLGVPRDSITFVSGDTDAVPRGKGNGGSSGTILGGSSIAIAVDQMIDRGRTLAADNFETSAADIEFANGRFGIAGTDRTLSLADVARLASEQGGAGLGGTSSFKQSQPTYPNGCHICEVEIDPATGETHLQKYVGVEDVGNVLNPVLVEAQIHGGAVQGMGQVLMEEIVFEQGSGQLLTGSFMDYAMPRATDIPPIVCDNVVVPTMLNPLGVKGVGEAGTVGALAATINAVCDALAQAGVADFQMPATPDRVWRAIQDAAGQ